MPVPDRVREIPAGSPAELLARRWAEVDPEAVAVAGAAGILSYLELEAEANRLARVLAGHGAGPRAVVAVVLPRTVDAVVAMVAVVKTGAGYLPVDPGQPPEWISTVLAGAEPACVLATTRIASDLPLLPEPSRLLVVDDPFVRADVDRRSLLPLTDVDRGAPVSPDDPAYVICPAGSPKGLVVSQAALAEWVVGEVGAARLSPLPGTEFEVAIVELLAPLAAGVRVELVVEAGRVRCRVAGRRLPRARAQSD